jgi:hypothetical protein
MVAAPRSPFALVTLSSASPPTRHVLLMLYPNCVLNLRRVGRIAVLAGGVCSILQLTGCMSARYKLAAEEKIPPAIALNLTAPATETPAPIAATLQSVIVIHGPGSWKRDAYWDEYVLRLENTQAVPVVVEEPALNALGSVVMTPGDHPWKLEKSSREAWKYNFGLAKDITVRVGTGALAVIGGTAAGIAAGGGFWVASSAAVLGGTVLFAAPVIGGTIYRNVSGRHKVEAEFDRRRLKFPITLAPGQTMEGSAFFRITPGPQELALRCRTGETNATINIPLTPLANLHLKETGPAAPASP